MVKILIIDDAALVRQYLKKIIQLTFKNVEVLVAPDGLLGIEKIKLYNPDIITLDYEMPKMNGIECLKEITKITKAPVIMISSFSTKGAKITMDALNIGAFDFLCKPSPHRVDTEIEFESIFLDKIEGAIKYINKNVSHKNKKSSDANSNKIKNEVTENITTKSIKVDSITLDTKCNHNKIEVIGIGISTGGPPVVTNILKSLPVNFKKPILIVQHMPAGFTCEFAKRLDEVSKINVKEAENGDVLEPGCAYVAPGGLQMRVEKHKNIIRINIFDGEKVSGHKPSADVLFNSMAECFSDRSLGIIMTGMGHDGSDGLLKLKNNGSLTWGQSKDTCVVYGMPKSAAEKGAVCEELSVDEIIKRLKQM